MTEIGRIILCMGRAFTPGKTEEHTRANIPKIKNMEEAFTNGLMDDSMMASGKMESSMGSGS